MAPKSKSSGPGGVPWAIVIPVVHAVVDVATHVQCPDCGNQVVLYLCVNCKKLAWPRRGQAAA